MGVFQTVTSFAPMQALVYLNLTIIFQMINFLVLLWLLTKFLYKPILGVLDKRAEYLYSAL